MVEPADEGPGEGGIDPASLSLAGHWGWRPEWTAERRSWWWYATFEHDEPVRRLAAEAVAALAPGAPVDVIPDRWLHLSLLELGYTTDFNRCLAYESARAAQQRLRVVAPLDLQLGAVDTMPGAVVLPVLGTGLEPLREHLIAAHAAGLSLPPQRLFEPHVSVAYVDRACHPSEVLGPACRRSAPVTTRLRRVCLVEVIRDRRHYRWTPRCVVWLRGRSPAPAGGCSRAVD